jgi:hypothetical protein
MTETWADAEDYDDIGESDFDDFGEDLDEESKAARRQRQRQRQRQIMLARNRREQQLQRLRQSRSPARAARPSRPAIGAIRSLDLKTEVEQDKLHREIEELNRRASRATWAAVASAAVDQGLATFSDDLKKLPPYVTAGARFAPLLLLSPQKKRGGVEGIVTDPRFVGGAGILGFAILGHLRGRPSGADQVIITSASTVPSGTKLTAEALDRNGNALANVAFTWVSASAALTVDRQNGTVTGAKGATGKIIVFAGGKQDSINLTLSTT